MSVPALPTATSKWHGYIYVIEFSNNTIKVGRSRNATKRLREHTDQATRFGISLLRVWISPAHWKHEASEALLIAHCRAIGSIAAGNEYFADVSFEDVVRYAERLPFEAITQEEIDSREKRAAESAAAIRDWIGGGRKPGGTSIPNSVALVFANPDHVFVSEIEPTPVSLRHVEEVAESAGHTVEEVLSWSYIDTLCRTAQLEVECRKHQLATWALNARRSDLLCTYAEMVTDD